MIIKPVLTDSWIQRFKKLAVHVSDWSKDPNAKIGAVIIDEHRRPVGLGYNGFPYGVRDDIRLDKEEKLDMIIHAEENAILIAGNSSRHGTIFVVGKPICSRCAGIVIQAGIKEVFAQRPNDPESKWFKTGKKAIEMFEEAEVKFTDI